MPCPSPQNDDDELFKGVFTTDELLGIDQASLMGIDQAIFTESIDQAISTESVPEQSQSEGNDDPDEKSLVIIQSDASDYTDDVEIIAVTSALTEKKESITSFIAMCKDMGDLSLEAGF